jgi:uncharacterized membrane protein
MEPLGWATAVAGGVISVSFVLSLFFKQLVRLMRELKKVVRAAKDLRDEFSK